MAVGGLKIVSIINIKYIYPDLDTIKETRLIDIILEELDFIPENLNEGGIEDTDTYKLIFEKVKNSRRILNNNKLLAIKSISCQLYREDDHGNPAFEKDRILDLLRDRDEKEYIELFRYYYQLIPNLEIHRIHGKDLIIGTNFQLELYLFLKILSEIITSDLDLAVEQVRCILVKNVKPEEWYNLFLGDPYEDSDEEDYEISEKERIDLIIDSVLG